MGLAATVRGSYGGGAPDQACCLRDPGEPGPRWLTVAGRVAGSPRTRGYDHGGARAGRPRAAAAPSCSQTARSTWSWPNSPGLGTQKAAGVTTSPVGNGGSIDTGFDAGRWTAHRPWPAPARAASWPGRSGQRHRLQHARPGWTACLPGPDQVGVILGLVAEHIAGMRPAISSATGEPRKPCQCRDLLRLADVKAGTRSRGSGRRCSQSRSDLVRHRRRGDVGRRTSGPTDNHAAERRPGPGQRRRTSARFLSRSLTAPAGVGRLPQKLARGGRLTFISVLIRGLLGAADLKDRAGRATDTWGQQNGYRAGHRPRSARSRTPVLGPLADHDLF